MIRTFPNAGSFLVLSVCLLSAPAFADSTAVGNATAGASATANFNGGDSWAAPGIGAAYCVHGVSTPIGGATWTPDRCMDHNELTDGAKSGAITLAEYRAWILYSTGITFRQGDAVETSVSTMSVSSPPMRPMMTVNGAWDELSLEQQRAVVDCQLLWNSNEIQVCQ